MPRRPPGSTLFPYTTLFRSLCRRRPSAVEHDPLRQPLERAFVGNAFDTRLVLPRDGVARVGELRGEVAVARDDQQSFGLVIEPTHRIHVLTNAPLGEQIHDRRPPLRVGAARDVPARLVEEDVAPPWRLFQAAAVYTDVVGVRIGLRPELGDCVA